MNRYSYQGKSNPFFGKKHSEKTIKKMRLAKLKNPTRYWLGKKIPKSIVIKANLNKTIKKGREHYNWKGGKRISVAGYILIYSPHHPNCNKRTKTIYKHRLVMEKHLGRFLSRNEVIHHKNGIKHDNRLKNLELMTNSEHSKSHIHETKPWKYHVK